MDQNVTVCMLSCLHNLQDDRIYWKEALSLKKAGYTIIHIGVGNSAKDVVTSEGIRLIQVYKKRYFKNDFIDKIFRKIFFWEGITKEMLNAAKKIPATVYHFHDLQINKIGPKLKALPQKPKVIYDVHESYPDLIRGHSPALLKPFNYLYALYIAKWELKKAKYYDAIITTEEYVWRRFKNKFPYKHCEIIYNYSFFQPVKKRTEDHVKLYDVIYSGAVSESRGIYEIITAALLLKRYKPFIKVLIIGPFANGRLKRNILKIIEEKQLADNVILQETVPFELISSFYLNSKIGLCIFHPINLYKNAVFIKTFEYMAFGLPVIGSNFGTIAHYIKKTSAGIIVDPLKPSAIANAILYLLNHPDIYEACSFSGIESIKKEYNWELEQKKIIALYKLLLRPSITC